MGDTRTLDLVVNAQTEAAREQLKALGASSADSFAQVDANLTKIEDKINGLADGFKKAGSTLTALAGGFLAGAVAGAADKFVEASLRALEYAGTLQKVAEQGGTTTKFLQEFRYAAQQNDVAAKEADTSLDRFNKTIGLAATGNRSAVTAFKALGVSVTDQTGAIKPLEQIYREVATAIGGIASPSEQAARATQLFGKEGYDLLPLLRQGAIGFDQYVASASQLGLVLGPEQIEHAAQAEQKFKAIKDVLSVEFASAITANADALLGLARAFEAAAGGALRYAAAHPAVTSMAGQAAIGAGAGAAVGGLPGALIGGVIGAANGAYRAATAPADPKFAMNTARNAINLLPKGSPERAGLEAQFAKDYPAQSTTTKSRAAPVNDQAQRVLDSLQSKVEAGGDPRQLAINSALQGAGVTADSDYGKKIAAAAAKVYDAGPGARAADAAKRKADSDAARAAAEKQRALNEAAASNRDVVGVRRAYNAAEANAADTPEARYALATSNIQDNLSDKLGVIGDKEKAGKLSALQAQEEATLVKQIAVDEQIVVDRNEQARKIAEQLALVENDIGIERDQLNARLELADTAAERRKIELRLLDLQLQEERAIQQSIIDSKKSTPAEVAAARKQLGNIDLTAGDRREAVNRGTEDPLQAYTRSVTLNAGQLNEALKGVEVDGLKKLDDGLTGLIDGTESVASAFKKMASSIISDLARILIEKAIVGPLASVLGGGAASSAGGLIGKIFGGGFADGGVPPAGKISLVGENGPEWIVGNGTARVVPMPSASPRSATTGASGGGGTNITVDARGANDPAEVDRRVRAGILAVVPALHSGIRDSTIAALKRPGLPGGRS